MTTDLAAKRSVAKRGLDVHWRWIDAVVGTPRGALKMRAPGGANARTCRSAGGALGAGLAASSAAVPAATVSAAAVAGLAAGSRGRATATSVLGNQHDDQDDETDDHVRHRVCLRHDAPQDFKRTSIGAS